MASLRMVICLFRLFCLFAAVSVAKLASSSLSLGSLRMYSAAVAAKLGSASSMFEYMMTSSSVVLPSGLREANAVHFCSRSLARRTIRLTYGIYPSRIIVSILPIDFIPASLARRKMSSICWKPSTNLYAPTGILWVRDAMIPLLASGSLIAAVRRLISPLVSFSLRLWMMRFCSWLTSLLRIPAAVSRRLICALVSLIETAFSTLASVSGSVPPSPVPDSRPFPVPLRLS